MQIVPLSYKDYYPSNHIIPIWKNVNRLTVSRSTQWHNDTCLIKCAFPRVTDCAVTAFYCLNPAQGAFGEGRVTSSSQLLMMLC